MNRVRVALALALALALGACTEPVPTVRQVSVLRGAVHVRAPAQYCVDVGSARSSADTAVVLIGRCSATGGVAAALVTVAIGKAASGGVLVNGAEPLAQFMQTEAGRKALARSGRAQDVAVLEANIQGSRLMLHLRDRDVGDYWRAVLGIGGRLVTVSAAGTADDPLTSAEGRRVVSQTVEALTQANPATKP